MTHDTKELNRLRDKAIAKIFMGHCGGFLGPLLCGMHMMWDEDQPTACTNGIFIKINPQFFLSQPEDVRVSIILHELWHTARLHFLRQGERDDLIWNYAGDLRINDDLAVQGHHFGAIDVWLSSKMPHLGITSAMSEEEIYDILKHEPPPTTGAFGEPLPGGDMVPANPDEIRRTVQAVVQAQQAAIRSNKVGDIPGNISKYLDAFLAPVVPWQSTLMNFFTDKMRNTYSYRRPNRRHSDIYLPSKSDDEGRITHMLYALDVSGSVSDDDVVRFNSEVKYIWDVLKPKKLTLLQFDTIIQDVQVFNDGESFDGIMVKGRGGTCLKCVHDFIVEHKPTATVIFSDLFCAPMDVVNSPVIWIAIGNKNAKVNQGQLIHIG